MRARIPSGFIRICPLIVSGCYVRDGSFLKRQRSVLIVDARFSKKFSLSLPDVSAPESLFPLVRRLLEIWVCDCVHCVEPLNIKTYGLGDFATRSMRRTVEYQPSNRPSCTSADCLRECREMLMKSQKSNGKGKRTMSDRLHHVDESEVLTAADKERI